MVPGGTNIAMTWLRMSVLALRWITSATVILTTLFAATASAQQSSQWDKLPRMQLERQFAGPLQHTVVQLWSDPVGGMECYIYLPVAVQHSPPAQSGYVQYGADTIGTVTCMVAPRANTTNAKKPAAARR